ncbi:MAG: ABC-2 transporter permease, partial [Thomasclavelia spiroformis]
FILIVGITLPMMGTSTLQYSTEQDEISNYNKILLTFPLTKKEIVKAKIISTLILSFSINLLISLPITLIYTFIYQTTNLDTALLIWLFGFILTFIMTAINNIGLFSLGNKKGTIVFVIFIIVVAISYVCSNIFIGIETIVELTTPTLLMFETLIAIILNIISFYACVKIYSIKNS